MVRSLSTVTILLMAISPCFGQAIFKVETKDGEYTDILRDGKKVVRFMNMKRDGSSKEKHELSFKPFYHVYDPVDGETLLTNGAGLAANKELLFPHHRGIFYAFNKVSYGSEKCDVWHGRNNEYVEVDSTTVRKRDKNDGITLDSKLSWHGTKGDVFASEERSLEVVDRPGGLRLKFESKLTTTLPEVKLDGDPQHAGCHFRAAMEVSKNGKANTYYIRPDGVGKPGETRNWDAKKMDAKTINLPWDACSFMIGKERYTCLRVPHASNPKETRGSERDYGRFGDYFEWTLKPSNPLTVKYLYWIQRGPMTVEQCAAMAKEYRGE